MLLPTIIRDKIRSQGARLCFRCLPDFCSQHCSLDPAVIQDCLYPHPEMASLCHLSPCICTYFGLKAPKWDLTCLFCVFIKQFIPHATTSHKYLLLLSSI